MSAFWTVIWNCIGGPPPTPPPGPDPVPEIDATNSVAAIALLLAIGAIAYRRYLQRGEQH